jgi:hypothetical protein
MNASTGLPGGPLTELDYESLERRWIPRELADAAGIRRVDTQAGAALVGRKPRPSSSYAGQVIPYFLPGSAYPCEYRLRRDYPDFEQKNGALKQTGKYLSPVGAKNRVYFPLGVTLEMLADLGLPIVVTEGEYKTLALWRLAHHNSQVPKFLPIGLGGVWNWRGSIGKRDGADGTRHDVRGAIPDLDLLAWEGRKVVVAFDAEVLEEQADEKQD